MQDLTPVGLSKDGKLLVLVSSSGEEFAVPVDHRLRTALRGDNARLGQLEMKMESALRPRDIQSRIRAGDSPETVAVAAQTTVEAIMPYAGPVLAERAHIARTAQAASVRRTASEAAAVHRTLADAAQGHFSGTPIRVDDVEWDAWRRDDGRWTLVANFVRDGGPRQAQFTYDAPGRYVVADNDDARLITGELAFPEPSRHPGRRPSTRRLSAVPDADELPLGDDAIELVRESPEPATVREEPDQGTDEATTEVPRDAGLTIFDDPGADHADADWIAHGPTSRTGTRSGPDASPDTDAATAAAKPHRKGRASVPSWDEIMFGGGKSD